MSCTTCGNNVINIAKGVATGIKNVIIKNPVVEGKATTRLSVCYSCSSYRVKLKVNDEVKASQCDICKCVLELKTRVDNEKCPINKW